MHPNLVLLSCKYLNVHKSISAPGLKHTVMGYCQTAVLLIIG